MLGLIDGDRDGLAETRDCLKAHCPEVVSAVPSRPVIATEPVAPAAANVLDTTDRLVEEFNRLAVLVFQDPPGMVVVVSKLFAQAARTKAPAVTVVMEGAAGARKSVV